MAAKHILAKYGDLNAAEAQIGTGPFKFKKYERGSVIEWEKNPNYFIPGLPYLDGVQAVHPGGRADPARGGQGLEDHAVGRVAADAEDAGR